MPGDAVKAIVVRLAATVHRTTWTSKPWRADLDLGDGQPAVFTGEGRTATDARNALTDLVMEALTRLRNRPVIVLGGSPDYADCIHLIIAEPSGWVVHVIRDGRATSSWHSDHDRDELLHQVLQHVGGQPTVVTL